MIAEESTRLASIVEDLLLASHLDSGKLQLAIVGAATSADADAGRRRGGRDAPPRATSRSCSASRTTLPPVRADPNQLRQVLANLVDNAIKYSPDGGEVRVGGRGERRLGAASRSPTAGLGIPAGEQRRIFEKFYRLDPNMTRGIGGTGLGLYISSELVRRFDGRIWVDSREGEGSTFHVELPATAAAQRERRRSRPSRRYASQRAGGRTRTGDLLFTSELLYQLSYSGAARMVAGA